MSISTTLANSINDALFNNTSYVETTVYVSLHTANPGTTGANEAVGGSYARQAAPAAASSSGVYTSGSDITFTSMPSGTFTHFGIWDAASVGNYLMGGALAASVSPGAGDTVKISAGNLTCTPA